MSNPDSPWTNLPVAQFKVALASLRSAAPKARYHKTPVWVLVRDLTWHGSGVSRELCRWCGYDPDAVMRKNHPIPTILRNPEGLR